MTQLPKNDLTILDCFCGAGVGAIGAEMAGFTTTFAFDNNKHGVRNYNKNIREVAHLLDMSTLHFDDLPNTDIITGGFPCTSYSFNGKGEGVNHATKGDLGQSLIDLILFKEPKGFLIENVKGLISKKHRPDFDILIAQLQTKFNVNWEVLDCSEYGVPQKRERVFIVGVLKTHKSLSNGFKFPLKSNHTYTIKDALKGLPEAPDGINNHELNEKWTIRNDEKPYVHKVPKGGNWKDLPLQDQKDFMKGAFYSSGGKTTFLAVMDDNKPSRTIMSSPMGKNSAQILRLSDGSSRRYTVRESLRLQSVPDSWGFDDETPLRVQYERCSGIPSLVSYKLMVQLGKIL